MIGFLPAKLRTIFCVGAHSDDIEIGAGGTILHLLEQYPDAHVDWVVFSANGPRRQEAQDSASYWLRSAKSSNIHLCDFQDSYFPAHWAQIKQKLESLRPSQAPDLVITHHAKDSHQDHRLIGELSWNAFRNSTILEYEIPKYDADLGHPNVYVPLAEQLVERKMQGLLNNFPTQIEKPWFQESTFRALMAVRGIECNAPTGSAEAFHARKLLLA